LDSERDAVSDTETVRVGVGVFVAVGAANEPLALNKMAKMTKITAKFLLKLRGARNTRPEGDMEESLSFSRNCFVRIADPEVEDAFGKFVKWSAELMMKPSCACSEPATGSSVG
jgi:hypothetical protein